MNSETTWLVTTMRSYFARELLRFALTAEQVAEFWTCYEYDVFTATEMMDTWPQPDDALTPLPEALRQSGWCKGINYQGTVSAEYALPGTLGSVFTQDYSHMSLVVAAIERGDLYTFLRNGSGWDRVSLEQRPDAHHAYLQAFSRPKSKS